MGPFLLVGLLTAAMAALTWQLWLLPTLLFKGVRLAAEPQVSDWEAEPPPAEAAAWLTPAIAHLQARGFALGDQTCVRGELKPSLVWRAHLRHKKDRTRAALSAWYLDGEDGPRPLRQELSLQVEVQGDRLLLMTTSDDVDDALWPVELVTVVLAGETDLARVLTAFERKRDELGADLTRARRAKHGGAEEVRLRRAHLLEHQQGLKLVHLAEQGGEWRLTWSGACMNAFYRFWPLRRRAVARQRREAARLLR